MAPGSSNVFDFDDLDDLDASAEERGRHGTTPGSNNVFDFDDLDELDASAEEGGRHEPSGAAGAAPEPLEPLREECAGAGLSVGWCTDASVLRSLLAASSDWGRFGIHALAGECNKLGVRMPEVNPQREEVLWRLRCAVVWKSLSVTQLEEECERREIPYYAQRWWLTLELGSIRWDSEKRDRWEEELKADLVRRLVQDSWPGEWGPLPAEGLPGFWLPRCRRGVPSLPAWIGPWEEGGQRRAPRTSTEVRLKKQPQRPKGWWPGPPRTADFKDAGPRVCWFYLQLPWFRGEVPGHEAEFAWSDAELEDYFLSDGQRRPQRRRNHWEESEKRQQQQQRQQQRQQQQQQQQQRQKEQEQQKQQQQQNQQQQQKQGQATSGNEKGEEPRQKAERAERPLDRHYRALGLEPDAPAEEVKRTYKRLVLRYHPDKAPGQQDAALFRQIQEAYEILCQSTAAANRRE